MTFVQLNRRFKEWDDKPRMDPEMREMWGLVEDGLTWDDLLKKRRVIILAEAGSGKSRELQEQSLRLREQKYYVFQAPVEDVGRMGLVDALSLPERAALTAFRESPQEAWFFLDSVDEAKSTGVKFERVVKNLANGIHGATERAHIVLSGRPSDWEFEKDLATFEKYCGLSSLNLTTPMTTPREELLRILHQERSSEPSSMVEKPFVALMEPLDKKRVRKFVENLAPQEVQLFLDAIDDKDLMHFARRPLDLQWLLESWQRERTLGSFREMIERSIEESLKEPDLDRSRTDTIDPKTAAKAANRIGASMVLGGRQTIKIPDATARLYQDFPLELADILSDWQPVDRSRLLGRPLFDPATFGRVRLHNDNEGVVRGFLTARWIVCVQRTQVRREQPTWQG